jgi:hypothetical protein
MRLKQVIEEHLMAKQTLKIDPKLIHWTPPTLTVDPSRSKR